MGLSNSLMSYEDVRAHFDRALASEKGLMLTHKTPGQAIHFRQRCYKYRTLDRARNTELYNRNDPMYGCSVYDVLRIDLVENIVYIKKISVEDLNIKVEEIK